MKSFAQHLEEAKQVGIIYHFTSVRKCTSILKDNEIRTMKPLKQQISFTRDNVVHEFAHVLLFQITNTDYYDNDRKAPDLEKLFKEYKKGKEGYFSAYSKRNLDEFAAELFAGYLIYGEPPKGAFGGSYLKKVYDWFVDNFNKKA